MAVTDAMRTQVSQLFVTLFDRAPSGVDLLFWVTQMDRKGLGFAQVAQHVLKSYEGMDLYPASMTPVDLVTKFLRKVTGDAPSAATVDTWVARLADGSPGQVVARMITELATYAGSDPDILRSRGLLENLAEVGLLYADSDYGLDALLARYVLIGVTADASSVDLVATAVDSGTLHDLWNPKISFATYDPATGTLVVTGVNFQPAAGQGNDIVASKLSFTGEDGSYTLTDTPDVDISSSTSFRVVLSATDRAAVAALLNKDGTLSMDGVTYNLAAGENWASRAGAALVIADLLGNGITVDGRGPTGTADYDITGNDRANRLVGNRGVNVVDGGGGADTMRGGDGDDTYVVDRLDDVVIETEFGGSDLVVSPVSGIRLPEFVEDLRLVGRAVWGTGNQHANALVGNDQDNILDGGIGPDTMRGGYGYDRYFVDDVDDKVIDPDPFNEIVSSVNYMLRSEAFSLTLIGGASLWGFGNDRPNVITGNTGRNELNGAGGKDVLDGGPGTDTLYGGDNWARDIFRFSERPERDVIADLDIHDRIDLSGIDADDLTPGMQSFTIVREFSADATGQLSWERGPRFTVIRGSTDADRAAEFTILVDHAFSIRLSEESFWL